MRLAWTLCVIVMVAQPLFLPAPQAAARHSTAAWAAAAAQMQRKQIAATRREQRPRLNENHTRRGRLQLGLTCRRVVRMLGPTALGRRPEARLTQARAAAPTRREGEIPRVPILQMQDEAKSGEETGKSKGAEKQLRDEHKKEK